MLDQDCFRFIFRLCELYRVTAIYKEKPVLFYILYYLRSIDTYVGSPCRNIETSISVPVIGAQIVAQTDPSPNPNKYQAQATTPSLTNLDN